MVKSPHGGLNMRLVNMKFLTKDTVTDLFCDGAD